MAVTRQNAKDWLRVEHDADGDVIDRLIATSTALVERYAPGAPVAVKDQAIERMIAYEYDTRGAIDTPLRGNIMRLSGAKAMLAPWRVRRARKLAAAE